jgi:hypothetical protein
MNQTDFTYNNIEHILRNALAIETITLRDRIDEQANDISLLKNNVEMLTVMIGNIVT